jgi:hypothetical protein
LNERKSGPDHNQASKRAKQGRAGQTNPRDDSERPGRRRREVRKREGQPNITRSVKKMKGHEGSVKERTE